MDQHATKADIQAVAVKIGAAVQALDAKIDAIAGHLDAKIDATAGHLDAKIDATAGHLDAKIDATAGHLDAKIDATAGRLDAKIDRVALELVKTQGAIEALGSSLGGRMVAMESRILTAVDHFLGQAGKIDRRQVIMDYRVDELEKRVKSIEDRPS